MKDQELKTQLVALLTKRQAHVDFTDAVADFREEQICLHLCPIVAIISTISCVKSISSPATMHTIQAR